MKFKTSEYYAHWPFEGTNYVAKMNSRDLNIILELTMMEWLKERKISYSWSIDNCITFKRDKDRLMFILRFQ